MEVRYASHCSYRIRYHMVFVLKYRKSLITEEIFNYLKHIFSGLSERYYLNQNQARNPQTSVCGMNRMVILF